MNGLTDDHISLISDKISELVAYAVSEKLAVEVEKVEFKPNINANGDEIIEVKITLAVKPVKWDNGGMFDMVAAASRALRENGVEQNPYFYTKFSSNSHLEAV